MRKKAVIEFWTYIGGRSIGEANRVLDGDRDIERKFRIRTAYLGGQPRHLWPPQYAEKLHHESRILYAIRLKASGVQQRPIGAFVGDKFVILFWATEKNDAYLPKGCLSIAVKRLKEILEDSGRMRPIEERGSDDENVD